MRLSTSDGWLQTFTVITVLSGMILAARLIRPGAPAPIAATADSRRSESSSKPAPPAPAQTSPPADAPAAANERAAALLRAVRAPTPNPAALRPADGIIPRVRGRWVVSKRPGPDVDGSSIMEIVDKASNGDVILIRPGLYIERLRLLRKSLTLRGIGSRPEEVMITSPDPTAVVTVLFSAVRLENLAVEPLRGYAPEASAVYVWSGNLSLKRVVARSQASAIKITQKYDDDVSLDMASSTIDGGYADLLVRGTARVTLREDAFANGRQPIVAWRDVHLVLKSCRFLGGPTARIYAYSDASVDVEGSAPRRAMERGDADAAADRAQFDVEPL